MTPNAISIIMPIRNGEATLKETLDSLERQEDKGAVREIILIDDGSSDSSAKIVQEYQGRSTYRTRLIRHAQSIGLGGSYNEGIHSSKTRFFLLMHQDVLLPSTDSFRRITAPFGSEDVVAAYPTVVYPENIWNAHGFWQKCQFSRFLGKETTRLTGKFGCFRRSLLLDKVGYFDDETFRSAGEDSDITARIKKSKLIAALADVRIIHAHTSRRGVGLSDWLRKETQLAEAYGFLLRKHGISNIKDFLFCYFRPILALGVCIPYVQMLFIPLTLGYMFAYTRNVFVKEARDPRVLLVPLVNLYLLFVNLFATARGFISGRQRLSLANLTDRCAQ